MFSGASDDFTVGGIEGRPSREPFGPESPRTSTVRAEPCDCSNDGRLGFQPLEAMPHRLGRKAREPSSRTGAQH